MHKVLLAGVLLAASITGAVGNRQEKRWSETYAKAVLGLAYDGAADSGTYQRVSSIDPDSGACAKDTASYSGSLGPLADDLSIHLRGPLKLARFAAYSSGSSQPTKLKRRSRHFHEHRRRAQAKQHAEEHAKLEKRACYDWVTATYPANGAVFSFQWTEGCAPVPAATPAPAPANPAPAAGPVAVMNAIAVPHVAGLPAAVDAKPTAAPVPVAPIAAAPAPAAATTAAVVAPILPAPASDTTSSSSSSGGWSQTGFYCAATKQKSGVTFLNNLGAAGVSGGWTAAMGNSLSYAGADGLSPAKEPTCLDDTLIGSNKEIIIMSDKKCGAQGTDCGVYRPDGVNYHGFSGEKRAFFWEFTMPDVPEDNGQFNGNMPAIWLLNAQIPRTQQYGACSAWPGAGELDIAEALASGERRLKATLHGNKASDGIKGFNAGSDDYFDRPVGDSIILGLVLADSKISIKVIDKSQFDFSAGAGAAAADLVTKEPSLGDYAVANVY